MSRVLITGGAGFIGSHTTRAMMAAGMAVEILDDLSTGCRAWLPDDASLHVATVRDQAAVGRAIEGCTAAIHLAALVSVPRSIEDPQGTLDVNVGGTLAVLEAARRADVTRVVLASSAAVYGDAQGTPQREAGVVGPKSPYAWSKLAAETLGETYARLHGLQVVCLRYFNVYGPRQQVTGSYAAAIPAFLGAARRGTPLTLYGGDQLRDFVNVEDVARANLLAATTAKPGTYNVGSGKATSIRTLVDLVQQVAGPCKVIQEPQRKGEPQRSQADISRLQDEGWGPQVALTDGLRAMLQA